MSGQCFLLNVNRMMHPNANVAKPAVKEKVMSYEEKSVGSTPFYKCEACPYMALAEDDIKFHLFTVHPELAKTNGLADNIQIHCPGCTSIFDAEETLRTHLRSHHKMGIKDIKKMIKSLVQIALKNAKLKKETPNPDPPPTPPIRQDMANIKIPQVIEIVPDIVNANSDLPKGVAFITVDELHKMSTPNFEKVDPKEIIQEASINIVYTNDISTQYVSVSEAGSTNPSCNVIQMSSVTPDLISSIQPRLTLENKIPLSQIKELDTSHIPISKPELIEDVNSKPNEPEKPLGTLCSVNGCRQQFVEEKNLIFHRNCHQNGQLKCPECSHVFTNVDVLHTHLWKIHSIDLELPRCDICGFKTANRHRLFNIHMKCHRKINVYMCPICSKSFKTSNQLSKHKLIHKIKTAPVACTICQREFHSQRRMLKHVAEVHEKIKPFKCSDCDYTTARKEQLTQHMRSHTASDHNALRRHKKQHSKDNVYKCKYCPYTAIQSTVFTSHMISKHPTVENNDVHRCPYCTFKSVSKDKYLLHLSSTHTDKESIQLLIEMNKNKANKPSWTIPSEGEKTTEVTKQDSEPNRDETPEVVNESIPIEVYDCDSLSESLPQNYANSYCTTSNSDAQQSDYNNQVIVTDLSKDDNNSDCLISESSNDTMMERHQYAPQHLLTYDTSQPNPFLLNTSVSLEQNILQSNNVNSLASNHCQIPSNISNNIMSNFPIRLPSVPQLNLRNKITLKPVDKISIPTSKVTGPIIRPTQILPVPSSSNSPVNISAEPEGAPRKKPKISVKSNLILKGPDQDNMFHSQQKMAFRRLEDNERFGLGGPVTFNNLITTQFMLQPEPTLSESPNNIMPYPQEPMLADAAITPVDNELNDNPQIFSFNQQMNVNSMTMLPLPQKIQTNDPSYIKLEATIKQNTQSPSLERMCNANLLTNAAITREYKASPPLEDIHKNMNEIKNEVKSDAFYNMAMNTPAANPPILDQYLIDNIIGEKYSGLMDLSGVVLQEIAEEQNDVIEIDDNSDDTKLLPRLDMFYPLESLYSMHNDFHFLDNSDIQTNNMNNEVVSEVVNRMVNEVPLINQKEMEGSIECSNDLPIGIQGDKPYACDQCEYRSSDHNALRRHKKQHSKDNVYKCKYCPYTAIQSTVFTSHMISKHPTVENNDVHRCPYCTFKSVSKDKYLLHLSSTHTDKESIQLLIEMNKNKANKPSWTIPSEGEKTTEVTKQDSEPNRDETPEVVNESIPIEVYDCDSLSESLPQNYANSYCTTSNSDAQQSDYNNQVIVTDLSKDDNNSDCLISESSNDTMMERHQYAPQHLLTYDTSQPNPFLLNTSVSLEQNILQSNNVNSLASNHCQIPSNISNNIMSNFPIRLPSVPQLNLRNKITLKPVDKISIPTSKVTGPIIRPTQILPVPSSSNSPVNISAEPEGAPRKKPKISVKSNLILKGPDQDNMFHSQQKMAFRRLEDNERFGLGGPVTFNNLITTQFMLQPEPTLSESPNNIMPYPQEPMLADAAITPVDNELNDNPQIFSFNQQMNVNSMTMLPLPQKIQTNDPSYIKLEATIKQNTQSPSLERMCNANLLTNAAITREYKASPPLEDIHKNMNEIKNEVKSDAFYNMAMNTPAANPPILDQYLIDNIIGEKYSGLMDLSGVVLQEIAEEQNDVIEIDDNSDDTKLLPRLDMFYPLESLYSMHNDFHFLDNSDIQTNNMNNEVVSEVVNRMVNEVPLINQKEMEGSIECSNDLPIGIQGMIDPVMNAPLRPITNKINVKNIELMKN